MFVYIFEIVVELDLFMTMSQGKIIPRLNMATS